MKVTMPNGRPYGKDFFNQLIEDLSVLSADCQRAGIPALRLIQAANRVREIVAINEVDTSNDM